MPLRARVISLLQVFPLQKLSLAKGHGPGKAETSKTILKCTFELDSLIIYPHKVPEQNVPLCKSVKRSEDIFSAKQCVDTNTWRVEKQRSPVFVLYMSYCTDNTVDIFTFYEDVGYSVETVSLNEYGGQAVVYQFGYPGFLIQLFDIYW